MSARKGENEHEADVWRGLNKRQQAYMQAIFLTDQAQEQNERLRAAMDRWSRPADAWRWMLYADTLYGHTPLKQRLVDAGVVDSGTGSTFEALEKRGSILMKYERVTSHPRSDMLVYVRLTTVGRKLVRQALGFSAPKKAPVGELREWRWRAMAAAWKAGKEGLQSDGVGGYGSIKWRTWLRLRDYRIKGQVRPLVEEYQKGVPFSDPTFSCDFWIHLTPAGSQYYRDNWQRYHDLYPDVDAPKPDADQEEMRME